MPSTTNRSGGDFLTKKSDITKLRMQLPSLKDILVVDDETFDADRLQEIGQEMQTPNTEQTLILVAD